MTWSAQCLVVSSSQGTFLHYHLCGPPILLSSGYLGLFLQGRSNYNMKLTTYLHVVPRLRIHGDVPPVSHTSSWHGAYLVVQLIKKFSVMEPKGSPLLCGSSQFSPIASQFSPIQIFKICFLLRSLLLLSSNLNPGLPCGFFSQGFLTIILYAFHVFTLSTQLLKLLVTTVHTFIATYLYLQFQNLTTKMRTALWLLSLLMGKEKANYMHMTPSTKWICFGPVSQQMCAHPQAEDQKYLLSK